MSRFAVLCLALTFVAQTIAPTRTLEAEPGTFFFGLTPQFAVSPDGTSVVFIAHGQGEPPSLWLRSTASGPARPLPGTAQASYPFWAADGRRIGFFAAGKLKTTPVEGGTVTVVCDAPTGRGGTWNAQDIIVFASGLSDPLRQVHASGGVPAPASVIDAAVENSHRWPRFLPDGRHLLFWAGGGKGAPQLKIAPLGAPASISLGASDSNGAYGAGRVIFKRGSALMALPIDPTTFAPAGSAVAVAEPLSADAGSFFASLDAAPAGTLLFTRGSARPARLTWRARSGADAGTVAAPGQYTNVTMSPDGARLAVSLTAGSPANRDVHVVELSTGAMTRLTTDPGVDATPVWSPSGDEVIFSSTRSGIYQMYRRAISAAASDTLVVTDDRPAIATDWSRDGRRVLFTRTAAGPTGLDIWVHALGGSSQPLVETNGTDDNGAFSPDGRWIAYQSNVSGRDEIWAMPLTAPASPRRLSQEGGTQPRWRGDGRELFFLSPDGSLMSIDVPDGDLARGAAPRPVLPPSMTLVIRHSYTATPDGQRILMPILDQSNPSVISVGTLR